MARADIDELKIVIEADDQASDKLKDLLDKLEKLGEFSFKGDAFGDLEKDAERAGDKLQGTAKILKDLENLAGKGGLFDFGDEISETEELYGKLLILKKLRSDLDNKSNKTDKEELRFRNLGLQINSTQKRLDKLTAKPLEEIAQVAEEASDSFGKLDGEARDAEKILDDLGNSATNTASTMGEFGQGNEFNEVSKDAKESAEAINETADASSRLRDIDFYTTLSQLDLYRLKADSARKHIQDLIDKGADEGKIAQAVEAWQKLVAKQEELGRKADEASAKMRQLYDTNFSGKTTMEAPKTGVSSAQTQGIKSASQAIKEWNKSVDDSNGKIARLTQKVKKTEEKFASLGKQVGKSASKLAFFPFAQLASGAGKATKAVSKLFTKLKTVAMYRALRGFIKMINEGFKEGTQNAYQWSKALSSPLENGRYAQNLDSLATSALYLKNAFGAVAIPIINAFSRTLNKMADMVVEALNVINRFVATISGAGSWTKAIRYPKEFAESLENATGRAKDLKDAITILGIDEINPLNAVKEPSGGGGADDDALDYSKMFEEVELNAEDTFSKLFDPLQKAWDEKGGALIASMEFAFSSIQTLLSDIGKSFEEVWTNGTGEETVGRILTIFTNINTIIGNIAEGLSEGWNTDGLGTEIFQNLFDILNGILGMWERITEATADWAKDINFEPIMRSVKDLTQGIEDLLAPIEDGLAWAWENIFLPLGKWGIEVGLPDTLEAVGKALGSIGSILKTIGESKAGEVIGVVLETLVEISTRFVGSSYLQPLKDFAEVLSDIAKILNGETTLKDTFSKWIEEMGLRISVQGYYLQKAWEALTNLDLGAMTDALQDFVDPTHSEVYINLKARIDAVEDKRKEKDKRLDFTAKINDVDEDIMPTGNANFGVVNGVRFAHAGGNVNLGKVNFDGTVELDATANMVKAIDAIPVSQKTVKNMEAILASKTERFNTTTGAMTANLSKKSEGFTKTTSAMTANLSKKSEGFTKTTGAMTANLSKKSEGFTKTTGAMTATLSKKSETFNKATGNMTATLSKKNETFSKTTDNMTANLTKRTDSIKSGDRWIGNVTAYVKSLSKASGFTGLSLSGNVTASTVGSQSKVAVALKKRGGVFSNGFWKSIPQYSAGTLNAGSMFIAGEAGAELVGNVGGRTEVLNQSQIAQAMASSMMQANASQNAILQEQNNLLRQLLQKDTNVTAILSTSALADGVARKNRRDGRTVIPVGV